MAVFVVNAAQLRIAAPEIGSKYQVWCNDNTYMLRLPRLAILTLSGLACVCHSRPAAAWIETAVLSDAVTVEIDKQGQAIVSHDLWMKIRGAPLKGTELDGIDSDAEPLPDAQVTRMTSSGGSESSKPLLLSRGDDDTLRIEVEDNTGLRNGTFAFRFKYRTDLRQRSRIGLRGSWVELAWVGPRYHAGLDVAKVTFRLPYAATAPRLPEIDPSADELAQGELPTSALLSTLRRGADVDELELVRPHVAKGEPVLWRIWAAPASFPWLIPAKGDPAKVTSLTNTTPRAPLGKGLPLILAAALAFASAMLVHLKHRAVVQWAKRENCTTAPFVPLRAHARAAATGLLLALSLLLAVRFDAPTAGAFTLVLAMACMSYRRPIWPRLLRGPGRWLPVHQDEAFQRPILGREGRWLDASTLVGKCVLASWMVLLAATGAWMFRTQPYLAMLTFMATVVPWPIFLTGRVSDLPCARRNAARHELEKIYRRLASDQRLRVHPIGRFSDGESSLEEIRLKLSAAVMPEGWIGLEVAVHAVETSHDLCLLLRLREGSDAHRCYQARWTFVRGRTAEERVAIVAPTTASRSRLMTQIRLLLTNASSNDSGYVASAPATRKKSPKSGGSGSVTSKPAKASSPTQATRAA